MKCPKCHGSGRVNEARQSVPCPVCRWLEVAAHKIARLPLDGTVDEREERVLEVLTEQRWQAIRLSAE